MNLIIVRLWNSWRELDLQEKNVETTDVLLFLKEQKKRITSLFVNLFKILSSAGFGNEKLDFFA